VLVETIVPYRFLPAVQAMPRGGPNHDTTSVMDTAAPTAFGSQQVARGAAMTVVFFSIVLLFTLLQRYVMKQERVIK